MYISVAADRLRGSSQPTNIIQAARSRQCRPRRSAPGSPLGRCPPQSVLQHERYGVMTYTIPGLTPGGDYTVNLVFAEWRWTSAGQRRFNVLINNARSADELRHPRVGWRSEQGDPAELHRHREQQWSVGDPVHNRHRRPTKNRRNRSPLIQPCQARLARHQRASHALPTSPPIKSTRLRTGLVRKRDC